MATAAPQAIQTACRFAIRPTVCDLQGHSVIFLGIAPTIAALVSPCSQRRTTRPAQGLRFPAVKRGAVIAFFRRWPFRTLRQLSSPAEKAGTTAHSLALLRSAR